MRSDRSRGAKQTRRYSSSYLKVRELPVPLLQNNVGDVRLSSQCPKLLCKQLIEKYFKIFGFSVRNRLQSNFCTFRSIKCEETILICNKVAFMIYISKKYSCISCFSTIFPESSHGLFKAHHLCEWLREIAPGFFTHIHIRRLQADKQLLLSYIYLLTGVAEGERLPELLDRVYDWHHRIHRITNSKKLQDISRISKNFNNKIS